MKNRKNKFQFFRNKRLEASGLKSWSDMNHLIRGHITNIFIIGAILFLLASGCAAPDSDYQRRELYGGNSRASAERANAVSRSSPEPDSKKTLDNNNNKKGKSNRHINSGKSINAGENKAVFSSGNSLSSNSRGNRSETLKGSDPIPTAGATEKCRDGTPSYSQNRRGTCSHHGGVAVWY